MLKKYLEYGYYDKISAVIALILGSFGEKLISLFISIKNTQVNTNGNLSTKFRISNYTGNNDIVKNISAYLNNTKHEAIVSAIVHGSIADNTTNKFSDFDGVLIYDQSKLTNSSSIYALRRIIKNTHIMMLSFDALQHHSWMLVEKKELENFNDNIFPSVIFDRACSIYPSNFNTLILLKNNSNNPKLPFLKLAKSIEQKQNSKTNLKYFYYYKNLVSEILLLPATWHQAFTGKPINKGESFNTTKLLFNNEKWNIIEHFECIRKSWDQSTVVVSKEIKALKYRNLKKYSLRLRNSTPLEYLHLYDDKVIHSINELITEMKNKLN